MNTGFGCVQAIGDFVVWLGVNDVEMGPGFV